MIAYFRQTFEHVFAKNLQILFDLLNNLCYHTNDWIFMQNCRVVLSHHLFAKADDRR